VHYPVPNSFVEQPPPSRFFPTFACPTPSDKSNLLRHISAFRFREGKINRWTSLRVCWTS
jgi:hypothetical protein